MAGARGPDRRSLVTRLFAPRNRRRRVRPADAFRAAASWLRRWGLLAAGAVVVLAAGPGLTEAVRRHPYFGIREIAVRTRGRVDAGAIRTHAGIEPESSIWDLDVAAVEGRLRAVPWVRSAEVRRELPSRVVIQVRQYRPVAIVEVAEPTPALYYVASTGRVFAPVGEGEPRDLPYITGLARVDLEGATAIGPRGVRRGLYLLRRAARGVPGLGAVSEVHVEAARGLTLFAVRPRVPIRLGWAQLDEKLSRVGRVLALWSGREAEMIQVNCQFEDQVIVRTRAPVPASGPPGARRPART